MRQSVVGWMLLVVGLMAAMVILLLLLLVVLLLLSGIAVGVYYRSWKMAEHRKKESRVI